jgi:hypothetical protein
MELVPFKQRMGEHTEKQVEHDFPTDARIGLAHLLADMESKSYLENRQTVFNELFRRARYAVAPSPEYNKPYFDCILEPLNKLEWHAVYDFCEIVYERLVKSVGYQNDEYEWIEEKSLTDVREYFSAELNLLLAEDNIAYQFVDGRFQRRGRAHTQKSIQRMGSVLVSPSLAMVRLHYSKARRFFDEKPEADSANCIKEALCALEACLNHYFKEDFSGEFTKSIKRHQGNDPYQIPSPIAESIIKLHAYRGSGQGVAHAAPNGTRVSDIEAELILNSVAAYVTYIVDLFLKADEEIPF